MSHGDSDAGAHRARADPGLFGPDSVTWQLHSDPMMWIAGVRALYLQALHPRAVRGVIQNSDFRKGAWGRLKRTANFVGTISYGTTEAAEKAGARVRRIHTRLKVTDPVTGERYGVDEPDLLLWVHCAEVDSYLHLLRRSGLPVTDAQADLYIGEHREGARLVGLDPAIVPANRAELAAYFERVRPELAAGPEARKVDDFLRRPPVHPLLVPARAVLWRHASALAYDSLPGYAHELYGRAAPDPLRVTRRLVVTGAVLRAVPGWLRRRIPPGHIRGAMARLGRETRPGPRELGRQAAKLRRQAAILDGPGRAQRGDGGDSRRWRKPV
ncbi:oxygenase MpaB family protein [Streptomyces sp. NPDC058665]|uniref:oxygenase MpaB family protein n=1 Tax=Streptomyces sp. NPDC058665 TaxID=3346586 RepID=UPI003659BCEE